MGYTPRSPRRYAAFSMLLITPLRCAAATLFRCYLIRHFVTRHAFDTILARCCFYSEYMSHTPTATSHTIRTYAIKAVTMLTLRRHVYYAMLKMAPPPCSHAITLRCFVVFMPLMLRRYADAFDITRDADIAAFSICHY